MLDVPLAISLLTSHLIISNDDIQHVLNTLEKRDLEVQDQDQGWYSVRIIPYRTLDNVIDGVVITFNDISELKLYKEKAAVEEKVRRLATIVMDSNDPITVQDFERNILEWNKGAEKMYGYTEAEAMKKNISEIVPKNKVKESMAFVRQVQEEEEEEEVKPFKTQRITKSGKKIDIWLTVTKLVDEFGKPVAVATSERDIGELELFLKNI